MAESKVSVEQASNMSLDEYINATGVVDPSNKKNRNYRSQKSNAGYENQMVIDESNDNAEFVPKQSMSWRLKYPSRAPGMPPLITTKKFQNGNNFNQRRQRWNWYDRDAPPHLYGINRNNQPNFKPQHRHNYNMLRDVAHNGVPMGGMLMSGMSTNLVPFNQQQQTLATLATIGSQMLSTPADYMDIAKKFIDKMAEVQQSRENKPKYNMSVQKEISEIQGKTLYYSCNDGSPKVISFDGPGVDNCQIRVNTTDMTMNQRFA